MSTYAGEMNILLDHYRHAVRATLAWRSLPGHSQVEDAAAMAEESRARHAIMDMARRMDDDGEE